VPATDSPRSEYGKATEKVHDVPVAVLDPASLSPREAEVLEAVSAHLSNAQIGQRLLTSVRTVESHVSAPSTALAARCAAPAGQSA
jgi:DNA-binding CsgD family transcriptional regulator